MTEPDNTTVSASGVWENSNSDVIRAGNAMNRRIIARKGGNNGI